MFGFLKTALSKIYNQCTSAFSSLFTRNNFDQEFLNELEKILINADTGIATTQYVIETLKKEAPANADGATMKQVLSKILLTILEKKTCTDTAQIYLLVGINGSGKTTTAAKLALKGINEGKKVLFVAGDTFRAAATQQLEEWGKKLSIPVVVGKEGQDPASVVFAGLTQFKKENFDVVIIDTAGRLQTKTNLMKELEKIKRVITTQLPNYTTCTLLTVDAMLGQNSLEQAKLFHESTALDGIILTKMDGTGKGGIVFAITHQLNIPVAYISYGEQPEQLKLFNAQEYVQDLLG